MENNRHFVSGPLCGVIGGAMGAYAAGLDLQASLLAGLAAGLLALLVKVVPPRRHNDTALCSKGTKAGAPEDRPMREGTM